MQIQRIVANNFKSLVDFEIELAKFNCLIGLNGCGKSTVLQFIDFLAQQVRGDLKGWLDERHWEAKDINSRLSPKRTIDFEVQIVGSHDDRVSWKGSFNTSQLHCTSERIEMQAAILEVDRGNLRILDLTQTSDSGTEVLNERIAFSYEGSVLSQLRKESLAETPSLTNFKNYFTSIKSLDLLSPEYLRQRTREAAGSIGLGGQRLSAYLHELGTERRRALVRRLKYVYPQLEDLHTKSLRSGWKQLEVTESYRGKDSGFLPRMTTEARHVNDGMLRLIAILAELESDHRFLLFDEIENGINPELVEFVLDALVSAPNKQVTVTTHSPMILNYMEDNLARQGVIYLYKTPKGHTKAIPFFSIPSLAEKLTMMGPGEAFVDTNLSALSEEIEAVVEGH